MTIPDNNEKRSLSEILTDDFIECYKTLRVEYFRENDVFPKEYNELERGLIEKFFQNFDEEGKSVIEIAVELLSGLISLQALPNMNHRTSIAFVNFFLLGNDTVLYGYNDKKEIFDRFAEESKWVVLSKRNLEKQLTGREEEEKEWFEENIFNEHLELSKEYLKKLIQSGNPTAMPRKRMNALFFSSENPRASRNASYSSSVMDKKHIAKSINKLGSEIQVNMKNGEIVLQRLRNAGALMTGHFRLTSGLHSGNYIQCARALVYPEDVEFFASRLIELLPGDVDYVVSPAIGALVIGYKVADLLGIPFVFAERDKDGKMAIRRGLSIEKGKKIVIVEDVITTGGSVREVVGLLRGGGVETLKIVSMVRRNELGEIGGVPFESLVFLDFEQYAPEKCPLCEGGIAIEKPGSRK